MSTEVEGEEIAPAPTSPKPPCVVVERTLAIIKPDAIDREEEIIEDIVSNGFMILQVIIAPLRATIELQRPFFIFILPCSKED